MYKNHISLSCNPFTKIFIAIILYYRTTATLLKTTINNWRGIIDYKQLITILNDQ